MTLYSAPRYHLGYTAPSVPFDLREGSPDILPMLFPDNAVDLISTMGATGVLVPADVAAIYLCDTASPLVDSLGLGPNLVAAGGPLVQRYGNGLPYSGTLWGKRACETQQPSYFVRAAGASGFSNPNASTVSILVVYRVAPSASGALWRLISHEQGSGGWIYYLVANSTAFEVRDNRLGLGSTVAVAADGAWHCGAAVIDDVAFTNQVFHDAGNGVLVNYGGTISDQLARFAIGSFNGSPPAQTAYVAVFTAAITSAMRQAFWSRMLQWSYPTDLFTTKTRAGRVTVPCGYQPGVGQLVATYGSGQPAHGFSMGPKVDQSNAAAGTTLPLDWRQATTQNSPPARYNAAMCYDSLRKKFYLFGGNTGVPALLNDTWEYDPVAQEWTQISSGGPSARDLIHMVYDSARDRVVLFGGNDNVALNANGQTYEFDPATRQWTLMAPVASPDPRWSYFLTYDSNRQRVLLYGGYDGATSFTDTYEYDGLTWTQVSLAGPTATDSGSLTYDPVRNVSVLFGGIDAGGNVLNETWEWDGGTATWTQLLPAAWPAPRALHAAWYDAVRGRVFVAFGVDPGFVVYSTDTWSYDAAGNAWVQEASASSLGERQWPTAAFDTVGGVAVLFGGANGAGTAFYNTTWTYGRGPVGLVAAARGTFLPIGSNDLSNAVWTYGGSAYSAVDGPSGMRDAARVTDAGGGAGYAQTPAIAIVGNSSRPFNVDISLKGATGTGRVRLDFTGDPAGAEVLTVIGPWVSGAYPEWTRASGSATPTRPAQNVTYVTVFDGGVASIIDFAEPAYVDNTDQPAPYYLRVGTAAAEQVAAQTTTLTGGSWADPVRGHLLLRLHGAPGATERMGALAYDASVWRSVPVTGLRGEIWFRCRPDFQVAFVDSNGYVVTGTPLRTGYVPRAGEAYEVDIAWDALSPLPVLGGTTRIAIMINGTFAASAALAAWVPMGVAGVASIKVCEDN